MNLLEKPKKEELPSEVKEAIVHTIIRIYPDGRVFPVKSWTTQKGVVRPKAKPKVAKPKKVVETFNDAKQGDLIL